jgi:tetratricopeptide (TPR) repeat protein
MPSADTLLRDLYKCGSYERGHAFLKEHASEITREFVSDLRSVSFTFITEAKPEPELATLFADLTVLAAILLGDNEEKGMAYYCKGSILSRLEKHAEALNSLHEAQAYLRLGTNTKQLANCLYDAALSYYKQDDHESARKLLEEVLTLQEDEKERAQTGAFLLTLAGEDRAAIEDMMCRLIPAAAQRSLRLDHVDAPETKRRICDGLLSSFATQEDQDLFRASWPAFLGEPDFHFFVVDSGNATRSWPPYAYGLLKTYHDNFNEWDLLGLEAVWFADSQTLLHLKVIDHLVTMARDLKIHSLCISDKGLRRAHTFKALLRRCGRRSTPSVIMQGARPGLYSAFTQKPGPAAFFSNCLRIQARPDNWDFEGRLTLELPLYRGEGRLRFNSKRAGWNYSDLEQLARHFFRYGFHTRAEGAFTGTLQAQILHQGYVDQPTVSLSATEDVCAYYATDKHRREEGGVVFEIDTAALLKRMRVYDSLATLRETHPWMAGGFYDALLKVMRALDAGRDDVLASGSFLQRCHMESRRRVESFGGGQTLGPPVAWDMLLTPRAQEKFQAAGVAIAELDVINEEFENFWNVALGGMATMTSIDADTGTSEDQDISRAYFVAFDEVRLKLNEAWQLNQFSKHNHPGWDLSPFGYITKTIRDKEFFSSGDVPGDCILKATIVDKSSKPKQVIINER